MLRNNNRNRDYLRSDRVIKRKRRRTARKFIILSVLLVLVMGGLVYVSRLEAFSVNNISVNGNLEVSANDLISVAEQSASSSWLYLFPRKNIALYPVDEIETELKSKYPRLANVFVHRTGLDSVKIQVIERKPQAIWCNEVNECFTVDDQGFIYAPVTESASTTELIRFSGVAQGTSSPIGTTINSSSTFSDIATLLQGMKERGLNPEEVVIRNNHEFAVRVRPGGNVIFSDIRPLNESLDNLSTALESPAFKSTSTPQSFEYIDTRFGNKIFFKLQD